MLTLNSLYEDFDISIQTHHVKGHQNREKSELTWTETLNVMADRLAAESKDAQKPKEEQVPAQVVAL